MKLKIRRSQKETGVMSKSVIFCLDARAAPTEEEYADIKRYRLGPQVIYNSAAAQKHIDAGGRAMDGSMVGSLKALGSLALASMQLNITVDSLFQGQHIECKSLEEVLAAEDALITACRNLMTFIKTAATFDGSEAVLDLDDPKVLDALG